VVYRINTAGSLTILWQFAGTASDGGAPETGLLEGSDGNLYGTAWYGGTNNAGTAYRMTTAGTLTNLWQFGSTATDGQTSFSGLTQGCDGNFYGTTLYGGTLGSGTVYRLSVPLTPPANQISGIQLAGTNVLLTVPTVAGETYQLQYRGSMTSSWSNVTGATITNSPGAALTFTNATGGLPPQGFYQFDITP
jgi:uncharacterized repeat protein (TIGR03803 family)